ncbi:hypothetical protein EV121DRAFT_217518 [Schizophyllum commune]
MQKDTYERVSVEELRYPSPLDLSPVRITALARATEHYKGAVDELEVTIQSLTAERDAALFELFKIRALQAPVRRVPPEILSAIFEMVVEGCGGALEVGRAAAAFRSVCVFWDIVASDTPRLWSAACTVPWADQQSHLQQNITRSRSLPMTLEDGWSSQWDRSAAMRRLFSENDIATSTFEQLVGSGHRFSTLALSASWRCFATCGVPERFALLTTVELRLGGGADGAALLWLQHAEALHTLKLRFDHVHIPGSFELQVPDLPRLTSLSIRGLTRGTLRFLTSAVRSCSRVRDLVVGARMGDIPGDTALDAVEAIDMPALATLTLERHTSLLLATIRAPQLKRLRLKDFDHGPHGIPHLRTLLERTDAQPRLEALLIERVDSGLPETEGDLQACLERLRSLRVLRIDDNATHGRPFGSVILFGRLVQRPQEEPLLPSLGSFTYVPGSAVWDPDVLLAFRMFVATRGWPVSVDAA